MTFLSPSIDFSRFLRLSSLGCLNGLKPLLGFTPTNFRFKSASASIVPDLARLMTPRNLAR
jgi:hypothetical protein